MNMTLNSAHSTRVIVFEYLTTVGHSTYRCVSHLGFDQESSLSLGDGGNSTIATAE